MSGGAVQVPERRDAGGPDGPSKLGPSAWAGVLARAVKSSFADGVPNLAGGLAYYALLSLFPALVVAVAALALVGQQEAIRVALDVLRELAPPDAVQAVQDPIEQVAARRGTASAALSIGIVLALFSASGYVGAFTWAANQLYEVEGERPFWAGLLRRIVMAVGILLILSVIGIALAAGGPLVQALGDQLGVGDTAVQVFGYLRWPILLLAAMLLFSLLYYYAPNVKHPGFRWITPGAVVGVLVFIVATVVFNLYVGLVADYGSTYGALGGVIVFLLWLWLFNLAILFGAEVDAELEREREQQAGMAPGDAPRLPRRDEGEGASEAA